MFKFLDYHFDYSTYIATFHYQGTDNTNYTEKIHFCPSERPVNRELLQRALFLCFILIGTSYYKAHPTVEIQLNTPLDEFQARFFNAVYQEGLSQFAFENHLTRAQLAHFKTSSTIAEAESTIQKGESTIQKSGSMIAEAGSTTINARSTFSDDESTISQPTNPHALSLQSGGKDSLLTATLFKNQISSFLYISHSDSHPQILDQLDSHLQIIRREIDRPALQASGGLNGHIPITYIIQSLALVQAIINHQSTILTSIGREGNEAHAYIDDLAVNHQWSKTWPAEQLFTEYIKRYISSEINLGSPLRGFSELKIAELFTKYCWQQYGHGFSSCNVANYGQGKNNQNLTWCGNCAKCANTYLLFSPFVASEELDSLYHNQSLFLNPTLTNTFKGLLGIDGFMKPFECIGEIDELRKAYEIKLPDYPDLPFSVPSSNFDYHKITEMQPFAYEILKHSGVLDELRA